MPSVVTKRFASSSCSRVGMRGTIPARACNASTMFSRSESSAKTPSVLRSSGQKREPVRHRVRRTVELHWNAVHSHFAAVRRIEPEEQTSQLRAARTEQTGEADDLASCERDVRGLELPFASQSDGLQHGRLLCIARRFSVRHGSAAAVRIAAHHCRDQRTAIELRGLVLADERAVAKHRDAIRNRVDLVEKVRDEQDCEALFTQTVEQREQLLHLAVVEAGGGFIENQHPRRNAGRAGDGDHLLNATE